MLYAIPGGHKQGASCELYPIFSRHLWIEYCHTWKMPVCGLPLSLEMLLETVLGTHTMKSWQIYSEKDGLTFKVRFGHSNGSDSGHNVPNVKYTRSSPSRVARYKKRSQEHNSVRITRSKSKKECDETEQPRTLDSTGENMGAIFSPCSVQHSPGLISPDPIITPELNTRQDYISQASGSGLINMAVNINTGPSCGVESDSSQCADMDNDALPSAAIGQSQLDVTAIGDHHTQYPCRHRDNEDPPDSDKCYICEENVPEYMCYEPKCKALSICKNCYFQQIPECCHSKHKSLIKPIT